MAYVIHMFRVVGGVGGARLRYSMLYEDEG